MTLLRTRAGYPPILCIQAGISLSVGTRHYSIISDPDADRQPPAESRTDKFMMGKRAAAHMKATLGSGSW